MIVLIEDDSSILKLVKYVLETSGYKVEAFSSWEESGGKFSSPELFILDIMLPGLSGLDILKILRESADYRKTPVMFLTARSSELDKVTGLDCGADDYLTKPFGVLELVSRVKALLRRSESQKKEDDVIKAYGIKVNRGEHKVYKNSVPVELSLKEYELLEYLILNKGLAVTRDRLLEDVWGYNYTGESRTVDVHIRALRKKLDPEGEIIETVKGVGYRIRKEENEK